MLSINTADPGPQTGTQVCHRSWSHLKKNPLDIQEEEDLVNWFLDPWRRILVYGRCGQSKDGQMITQEERRTQRSGGPWKTTMQRFKQTPPLDAPADGVFGVLHALGPVAPVILLLSNMIPSSSYTYLHVSLLLLQQMLCLTMPFAERIQTLLPSV